MDKLHTLIAKKDLLVEEARAILAKAEADGDRETTEKERRDVKSVMRRIEDLNEDIKAERDLQAAEQALPIPSAAELDRMQAGGGASSYGGPRFSSFHDFVGAVLDAGHPHAPRVDDRLLITGAVPSTWGQEAVGADGGFTVPSEFMDEIFGHALEKDSLLPFCRRIPISGNAISIPVSEVAPWASTGIRSFWDGEGQVLSQTKPALEQRELRLRKLVALVPVTDELLEDSTALAAWLPMELGNASRWKVNDAIVNGNGTGQPQGFINSGAIVEQAAEAGQTADTIVAANVAKMYARCTSPSTGIWIIHPDSFHQLPLMVIGDQPVWLPQQNAQQAPAGLLLGRPIILSDTCQTLGDAGDLYFSDLMSYAVAEKSDGPRLATSAHLWFDYGMTAFRLTLRIDGKSLIRAAVTPPNSSVTRSPFVRLAARA